MVAIIIAVIATVAIIAFMFTDAGQSCMLNGAMGCMFIGIAALIFLVVLFAVCCTGAMFS